MLTTLLFVLRRRWPILLLVPALVGAIAYAIAPRDAASVPETFVSTVTIAADQSASAAIEIQQTVIDAEKGTIAESAAAAAGEDLTADGAGRRLDATFDEETFVVTLEVEGTTPEAAVGLAQAYAGAFLDGANGAREVEAQQQLADAVERRDRARAELDAFVARNGAALAGEAPDPGLLADQDALRSDVDEADAALNEVEREVRGEAARETYRLIDISDAEAAADPPLQIPDSAPVRTTLGLLLGVVGAAVVVAVVERLNPRIDSPSQATDLVGAPVLAMVPVVGRRRGGRRAILRADAKVFKGPFAEAFRALRTHLEFRATAEGRTSPPRIMVTSATPSEGKSTTAAFLGLAFSEVGRPPVVVGGDLRRPSVHQLFGIRRVPGLSSRIVGGGSTVALDEIVTVDPVTGVAVVPAGPSVEPVNGLLGDLTAITAAAQVAGRTVILDTAPVMVANDAVDFLPAVDWVVVVVRIGRSTVRSVRQMVQSLGLDDATVVGVVMVGSIESNDAKRYFYSYYSDRRSGELGRRAPVPVPDGTLTTSGSIATAEAT